MEVKFSLTLSMRQATYTANTLSATVLANYFSISSLPARHLPPIAEGFFKKDLTYLDLYQTGSLKSINEVGSEC